MKWFRILLVINILLALGLGIFAFDMLPYANAVSCEASKSGSNCSELSLVELIGYSLVPAIVIFIFVLSAFLSIRRSQVLGVGLACIPSAVVVGWFLFIATA